jgi:hypothetical protein
MQTIICLGNKSCDIGELFEKNENFKVKLIDKNIEGKNCFSLQVQKTPEEYETNCPDMTDFLSDISDNILFITSGDCDVVSASLTILKQIKQKNISVLYLIPDIDYLRNESLLINKVVFNVFQEYARSGVFKEMFLFDSKTLEAFLGDIPIADWYEEHLNLIYKTYSAINSLKSLNSIIENYFPPSDVSRISTFGMYDLENNIEKMFFDIKNINDKCYNFFINENVLKTDNKLFKVIKEQLKNKVVDNTKISYRIYSTKNENNYCYVTAHSKFIQSL